ncbi:MAG: arginine--tRNA ligase [Deltaproteobacteria bacterium]|nr:arginine--tRNA ligase [Deltaproteobacteria bacterium]
MSELIADIVRGAVVRSREEGHITADELPPVQVERPRREQFGDYSTNIAMLIGAREGVQPRKVAEAIAGPIGEHSLVTRVEVAGPGFINITMDRSYWMRLLTDAVSQGDRYGETETGAGKRVLIEYVSANPTGPLHIGHGRGAAFGDSLANVLDTAGYDVTREFYINDAGSQVKNLAESIMLKVREQRGETVEWGDNHYKGEYIGRLADEVVGEEDVDDIGSGALKEILGWIERDLSDFNIRFDNWYSESALYKEGRVERLVEELKGKGHVEEREGAVWFRSTDFGDDKDRVVIRENGEPTYFASDIAYHFDKYERGYDSLINIWGADHHGYIPRIKAVVQALGHDKDSLKVILAQMVTVLREGKPVTMSKRSGEFITLRDVLDEVGSDATRFFFLMRKPDAQMEFDLELAKRQAPENPVYYLQYAHARICSIINFAQESGTGLPAQGEAGEVDLDRLDLKEELDIIRHIASFPEIVRDAAISLEPHRITFYLQELAGKFHPYYNKHRIVTDDAALTVARLYLCSAIRVVLRNGLALLGVSAPEKM